METEYGLALAFTGAAIATFLSGIGSSIGLGIGQGYRQKPPQKQLVLWRQTERTEHASGARLSLSQLVGISKCRLVHLVGQNGDSSIERTQCMLDDGQLADATANSLAVTIVHVL